MKVRIKRSLLASKRLKYLHPPDDIEKNMATNYETALHHFQSKRIAAAKPLFANALEEDSGNLDALYKFGICQFRLQEFKQAEDSFRSVTENDPEHFEAWYYIGLSLERQGSANDAQIYFRMSLRINPGFAAARKKMGLEEAGHSQLNLGEAAKTSRSTIEQSQENPKKEIETKLPDGPGELLYSSRRRRLGSFPFYIAILFVGAVMLVYFGTDQMFGMTSNRPNTIGLTAVIRLLLIIFCPILLIDMILRSLYTKNKFYERRIDIFRGILFRRQVSIWLYQIIDLEFSRNPIDLITQNATITVKTETDNFRITGLIPSRGGKRIKSVKFTERLFEELRLAVRDQRGIVKKLFV
jgi:tetratricopeptide (TPR) repeat protein